MMRCIVCVLWSPRRVLLGSWVFLLSRVSGWVSWCVNVKRSGVMEMLGGGQALGKSAGSCCRHSGICLQATWRGARATWRWVG